MKSLPYSYPLPRAEWIKDEIHSVVTATKPSKGNLVIELDKGSDQEEPNYQFCVIIQSNKSVINRGNVRWLPGFSGVFFFFHNDWSMTDPFLVKFEWF